MQKQLTAFLSLLLLCVQGFANIGPQGFSEFSSYYFVETGTLGGDGTAKALNCKKFKEIYSIDIDPLFIDFCRQRFKSDQNIHLVVGDSSRDLWDMISRLDKPITFFLDAHHGTPDRNGGKNTPILEELEQIKYHPIKNHTILIDDMHCCGTILFDYLTKDDLIRKIMEINPNYVIRYVPGGDEGEYPENVMVAEIK